MSEGEAERIEGYRDGRNPDSPKPSNNRSWSYRHGFICGRADITNKPAFGGAAEARRRCAVAEVKDWQQGTPQ